MTNNDPIILIDTLDRVLIGIRARSIASFFTNIHIVRP